MIKPPKHAIQVPYSQSDLFWIFLSGHRSTDGQSTHLWHPQLHPQYPERCHLSCHLSKPCSSIKAISPLKGLAFLLIMPINSLEVFSIESHLKSSGTSGHRIKIAYVCRYVPTWKPPWTLATQPMALRCPCWPHSAGASKVSVSPTKLGVKLETTIPAALKHQRAME